jgi:hypothetical protein
MNKMENNPVNIYTEYLDGTQETSKIFGFIPMFSKNLIDSIIFYGFLICISFYIDYIFNTYFILPFLAFLLIAEHRRLFIVRQSILELCITDEIYRKFELESNSDFLQTIGESKEILECDRSDIFEDNLTYCNSISRINFTKKHYRFLFSIVFLQSILYFF